MGSLIPLIAPIVEHQTFSFQRTLQHLMLSKLPGEFQKNVIEQTFNIISKEENKMLVFKKDMIH